MKSTDKIELVSFLDEKDDSLQDIKCSFNIPNFKHKYNDCAGLIEYVNGEWDNLEINIKVDNKLNRVINDMLFRRYDERRINNKLNLKILNEFGIIIKELNVDAVFNGFRVDLNSINCYTTTLIYKPIEIKEL